MSSLTDQRAQAGYRWACQALGRAEAAFSMVAGDASFRRYFRLTDGGCSWVLMDAPPAKEDSSPFIDVDQRLRAAGLHAPEILAHDLDQGFLLLEDFGDTMFRELLDEVSVDRWFPRLFELLGALARDVDARGLPAWDRPRLQEELELFTEWYLKRHLHHDWGCQGWDLWEDLCTRLIASAEAQPQVFVHRDFHSCNLLLTPDERIGVIDFQDAVRGPLSYDLASLLWDRYLPWPRDRLEGWMEDFRQLAVPERDRMHWVREVDWMGLQRNLKIVGIFARLHYRDGKAGYLDMAPRFFQYLRDVLPRYEEFEAFDALLETLPCAP